MNKEEQISKIFYEMEEDTSNIDFELNQRNIKRRNRIKEILKKDDISKAEVKEKIEKGIGVLISLSKVEEYEKDMFDAGKGCGLNFGISILKKLLKELNI